MPVVTYDNFRWEPAHHRKGDRFLFVSTQTLTYTSHPYPVLPKKTQRTWATVTRNTDTSSATFNRWYAVVFDGGRTEKPPEPFWGKDEAMAWATAIVKLNQ